MPSSQKVCKYVQTRSRYKIICISFAALSLAAQSLKLPLLRCEAKAMSAVSIKNWIPQIRVLEQMLNDRRYTQVHLALIGHGAILMQLCSCLNEKGELVHVYITEENKVGVKALRKIKEESKRSKCASVILLCPNGLTPFAQKELNAEEATASATASATQQLSRAKVEVFRKPEFSFNVTRHSLVPPHTPLTPAEKKQLLTSLGCKATSLPKIKDSDPVIKYLGLPLGTVVAISRRFGSLEVEQYYRLVVA